MSRQPGEGQSNGRLAGKRPTPELLLGEAFRTQGAGQPVSGVPHLFGDDPHSAARFAGGLPQLVGCAKDRRCSSRVLFGLQDEGGSLQRVGHPPPASQVGDHTQQLDKNVRGSPGLAGKEGRFGGASERHGEDWSGWQAPSGADCLLR